MCSKGLFMFMIVASVTALIFGASKEKFSKITELARDDTCIKLNEECAPPEKSCCKDRPCKCNMEMKDCPATVDL
uniref:U23-Saltitoxin-Pre1f_1 n=1 Tax=Phidippus regius TaxID=1905328 RepID=A0A482ZFF0_9ARAC